MYRSAAHLVQPKQIKEIKEFLITARRKDVKSKRNFVSDHV
jgi:hypothetical protein